MSTHSCESSSSGSTSSDSTSTSDSSMDSSQESGEIDERVHKSKKKSPAKKLEPSFSENQRENICSSKIEESLVKNKKSAVEKIISPKSSSEPKSKRRKTDDAELESTQKTKHSNEKRSSDGSRRKKSETRKLQEQRRNRGRSHSYSKSRSRSTSASRQNKRGSIEKPLKSRSKSKDIENTNTGKDVNKQDNSMVKSSTGRIKEKIIENLDPKQPISKIAEIENIICPTLSNNHANLIDTDNSDKEHKTPFKGFQSSPTNELRVEKSISLSPVRQNRREKEPRTKNDGKSRSRSPIKEKLNQDSRNIKSRTHSPVNERRKEKESINDSKPRHSTSKNRERHIITTADKGSRDAQVRSNSKRSRRSKSKDIAVQKNDADGNPPIPERQRKTVDLLTSKTGGAYIPPARLRLMQAQITDKSSVAYQRIAWEALKKSIHGYINKVNTDNIGVITRELLRENIVRGRGLLTRSIIQAQAASPTFTHVYAALVSVINSKFPNIGELLLKRLVIQFKRGFRRNDKNICLSSSRFIAHLVNQRVAHEILALEILTLLVETPTDDSVEVAIAFLKECGQKLTEVSAKGINAIFEMLKNILHEGKLDKRVQYMIEVVFQVRKDGFKDHQSVVEALELVEENDQFTHLIMLDEATEGQDILNVFKFDEEYTQNEDKYKNLSRELLGSDSEGGSDEDGSSSSGDSDDSDDSDAEEKTDSKKDIIIDNTETNLIALRRTIYLTIHSSLDYEECAHKLMKMELKPGQEMELCHMFLDCCAEQRTYEKFYGLLAQRFCMINKVYIGPFEEIFKDTYLTTHRLDTNRLRNVSKFFAHLLFTDAIGWDVLECIKLNEEDTTSSSRIFIKILFQELAEYMGLGKLNTRLKDSTLQEAFSGLFPRDNPKNTRFAINFFTSIGLGGLTDELREHLKAAPKAVIPVPQADKKSDSSNSDSSSDSSSESSSDDSSSSSSSGSSSTSSSSSDDGKRKKKKNMKKQNNKSKLPEKTQKKDTEVSKSCSDNEDPRDGRRQRRDDITPEQRDWRYSKVDTAKDNTGNEQEENSRQRQNRDRENEDRINKNRDRGTDVSADRNRDRQTDERNRVRDADGRSNRNKDREFEEKDRNKVHRQEERSCRHKNRETDERFNKNMTDRKCSERRGHNGNARDNDKRRDLREELDETSTQRNVDRRDDRTVDLLKVDSRSKHRERRDRDIDKQKSNGNEYDSSNRQDRQNRDRYSEKNDRYASRSRRSDDEQSRDSRKKYDRNSDRNRRDRDSNRDDRRKYENRDGERRNYEKSHRNRERSRDRYSERNARK